MAGRSRLPFEFHPIPLLLSRESATNALRDRFAFWPVLADHGRLKKKKGKKKGNRLPFAGTHRSERIALGRNRVSRKDAQWSHIRRCGDRCFTALNADSRTWPCKCGQQRSARSSYYLVSERKREREEKKERKEFDKIFESESFDSPDADLRDTGSRLLSLFERLVAVVTWLITFTVKFCDKMLR